MDLQRELPRTKHNKSLTATPRGRFLFDYINNITTTVAPVAVAAVIILVVLVILAIPIILIISLIPLIPLIPVIPLHREPWPIVAVRVRGSLVCRVAFGVRERPD